ncbi:MAG: hypothetical protein JWN44_4396 [Myxococcales bacterium]|nr:hypothetical protein [Myxococcales bacterium]
MSHSHYSVAAGLHSDGDAGDDVPDDDSPDDGAYGLGAWMRMPSLPLCLFSIIS